MFKTQEQIDEVASRTGVSAELVRKLSVMMSKVKLAEVNVSSATTLLSKKDQSFTVIELNEAQSCLKEALNFFENEFLNCALW